MMKRTFVTKLANFIHLVLDTFKKDTNNRPTCFFYDTRNEGVKRAVTREVSKVTAFCQ